MHLNQIEFYHKIKNIDYFTLQLINKFYKEISDFLNDKYKVKNSKLRIQKNISNNQTNKKEISLYLVDFFSGNKFDLWIENICKDKFLLKFNENNPDYLIYNVYGNKHLNSKYDKSIKIAIFTENIIPNLNQVDYAIGYAHINYLDRYFKFRLFTYRLSYNNFTLIKEVRKNVLKNPIRNKFCAAVISNGKTNMFRIKFINELNKYKKIDMGGRFKNNVGGPVENKIEFLSNYKFSIAMENSEGEGYTSEKIYQSFISGTIPIYYGNYNIDEFYNPKAYILIRDERDIKKKIEYIKKIDSDEKLYKSILKQNILINYVADKIFQEAKEFLWNIFKQDKSKAFRRYS